MVSPVVQDTVKVGVVSLVTSSVLEEPLSEPATRSGVPGTAPVVSMVTARPLDAADSFPAASLCFAVTVCAPSASVDAAVVTLPPEHVPVAMDVDPARYNVTVLLPAQETVKSGVVSFVTSSVLEEPLSDAASRSGAPGAAGAVVSTVTESVPDSAETLPATSVWVAVMGWLASLSVDEVGFTVPPAHVAMPTEPPLARSVTVAPLSQENVKLGVVSLVRSSVADVPESDAASRSGVPGAAGAVVSMVTVKPLDAAETAATPFVCFAVTVWSPSACAPAVRLTVELAQTAVTPVPTLSIQSSTVLPSAQEISKVGVLSLVILSVSDVPESDAAARSGVPVATGTQVLGSPVQT